MKVLSFFSYSQVSYNGVSFVWFFEIFSMLYGKRPNTVLFLELLIFIFIVLSEKKFGTKFLLSYTKIYLAIFSLTYRLWALTYNYLLRALDTHWIIFDPYVTKSVLNVKCTYTCSIPKFSIFHSTLVFLYFEVFPIMYLIDKFLSLVGGDFETLPLR